MGQLQPQFKNPATADPQVLFKWAQDLITQLRTGNSTLAPDGRSGVFVPGQFFSLVPNDSSSGTKTANTTNLQAAIDYAYGKGLKIIQISAGVFWFNPGIYLDAPGNLRSSLSNPTISNFSLWLKGSGNDSVNSFGTELKFSDVTQPAVIVGTGQHMQVSDLSIIGNLTPTSRAALPTGGIGLALAGSGGNAGGLVGGLIERVSIHGFRQGVVSGFNAASLCENVTLFKCNITQCFNGWHISQTQNYIDAAISCLMADNTFHILSDVGKAVTVIGGNYSGTNSNHNAFTIGSTSALSSLADTYFGVGFTNYTFTTTLSADDQPMRDGAYTAFCVNTAHFGLVPLVLTAYNTGTRVATFKLAQGWMFSFSPGTITTAGTDIQAEIQACTTLYACEKVTVFSGNGFNARGVHIEQPGVVTTLAECTAGFGGDPWSSYEELNFNYTQSQQGSWTNGATPSSDAIFLCQTITPFFRLPQGHMRLAGMSVGSQPTPSIEGPLIEILDKYRLDSERNDFRNPRFWLIETTAPDINNQNFGCGNWDTSPFQIPTAPALGGYLYSEQWPVPVATPFQGWRPARYAVPRLTPDLFTAMQGPGSLGSYPPLYGDIAYSVQQGNPALAGENLTSQFGPTASLMVRSQHDQFSWGQNLTVTWSYKGQTNVVVVNSMSALFPGLKITLNNGSQDQAYVVTGVLPTLGYITVRRFQSGTGLLLTDGTQTTIYTATTIKQAGFSLSYIGTLPAAQFVTNANAGAQTAQINDLTGASFCNLKLTSVGAANYTTRTAALMFGDIAGAYPGLKFMVSIQNTNAGTTTLVGGTGVTINGTATIAQNTARLFEVEFPTSTTCTFNSLGVTSAL